MTDKKLQDFAIIAGVTIFILVVITVEYWLFSSGFIPLDFGERSVWANRFFKPAAIINFIWSVIWSLIWYIQALKGFPRYDHNKHFSGYRLKWIIYLLICLFLALVLSYFFGFKSSPKSVVWFGLLLLTNSTLTYWLITLFTTPKILRATVVGESFLPH